ncbi:FadR/GntR family transcriptional regulator [Nocardia inohanensis]|uniref:FadR/GntR family transcriptional regulator n=1 Tax=Nocardia inohanensis TaxID=209246 RepID=UPI00082ABE37|nr:GntR family transcriptional regulator [Nocardia inohanensis]
MAELAKPKRVANLSQQVADEFAARIAAGDWPVGTKIPSEPELMAALGVSRSTIREAVRSLVHTRMLEPRPGDGTYVRSASNLEFPLLERVAGARPREAMELRAMLEQRAARLAAVRRTPDDADDLRAVLARIEHAVEHAATLADFTAVAAELFTALARIADNPLLTEVYQLMLNAPGAELPPAEWHRQTGIRWHAKLSEIAEAVIAGDPARAEDAVRRAEQHALADLLDMFPDLDRPEL